MPASMYHPISNPILARLAELWNPPHSLNTLDIAKELNLSESVVVRMLAEAKRQRLVPSSRLDWFSQDNGS